MTKNQSKIPKRRFKGFTGEWEKRKLWEVTNSYSGGTPKVGKSEYYGGNIPFIRSAEINSDSTGLFITELGLNNSSAKMVEIGYILYALYGATSGEVGISRIKGAINQAILAIIPKSGYDTQFITQWLRHEKYKIIDKYLQGGQGNLSGSIVKNLEVMFPSLEEQQKIGEFFSELDERIELQKGKVEKMKELKKAYLSEMFPAEGETTPKRRFKGFIGEWEEVKLGDIADIVRGASPRPIQDPKWFDNKSEIGWLRISDVTEQGGRINYLEQRISVLGEQKTRVLVTPHLLLSIAATVGKPVINYVKTGVHDGFLIFLNPKFDLEFMYQWLEMFSPKWKQYGQPGSQVNLNSDIVKNQKMYLPNLQEQQKIGEFFSELDEMIELHEEKLKKLQDLKQAYLNELLV